MAESGGQRHPRDRDGWRKFGAFWIGVLSLMAAGTGAVQWVGAPGTPAGPAREPVAMHLPAIPRGADDRKVAIVIAAPAPVPPLVVGRDTPGPIADPDPALLEPLTERAKENLPRISSDGRAAMQVYAAGFDHSSRRPRVGLLLAGIGMNEAESDAAIRALPGGVSLAVSPYATNLAKLLATARTAGHEYLIAIPMEPAGFPLNDPGPYTLMTSASPATNVQNLHWALSRIDGYVGATGIIGTMRGERLAAMADQMEALLSEFSERGLMYVDPRERGMARKGGAVAKTWGRHADLVIDDPSDRDVADRAMIDAKLAALEQQAKDTGSALGIVMRPLPVTVARIAAWASGLADRGLALAPVSALALPPADVPVKLSERD